MAQGVPCFFIDTRVAAKCAYGEAHGLARLRPSRWKHGSEDLPGAEREGRYQHEGNRRVEYQAVLQVGLSQWTCWEMHVRSGCRRYLTACRCGRWCEQDEVGLAYVADVFDVLSGVVPIHCLQSTSA